MNIDDVTLEVELTALDELYRQNEHRSDDIRDAINERRLFIRRELANERLIEMLIEHLGVRRPVPETDNQLELEFSEPAE